MPQSEGHLLLSPSSTFQLTEPHRNPATPARTQANSSDGPYGASLYKELSFDRWSGEDFDQNERLLQLIADPGCHCVVLYPGPAASNISLAPKSSWLPAGKQAVVFVIDGTWACAKSMLRKSKVLSSLPQICFTPGRRSEYQFRKQPAAHCLSTLEAVHEVLAILEPSPEANGLLFLFRAMVSHQISFTSRPLSEVLL